MEFTFEADPSVEVALGSESGFDDAPTLETNDSYESWDLSDFEPLVPTKAKPGSEDKVKTLSARYAAGVPLWDPADRYDHGPDAMLAGLIGEEEEEEILEDDDISI